MASHAREPTALAHQSQHPASASLAAPHSTPASPLTPAGKSSPRQHPLKPGLPARYEPVHLTGAAAVAEQKRHDDAKAAAAAAAATAAMTSPNPGISYANPFVNSADTATSRPADAPPPSSSSSFAPPPPGHITSGSMVAEPMEIDNTPVSPATRPDQSLPQFRTTRPSGHDDGPARSIDDHSNKAVTYPPPPQVHDVTPTRNNSVPTPASSGRSSSAKKHKCPHCNTEFTRHHNLKSHLLTHSQEKPFACSTCQAKFRRLHDLKRHTKLHTGERPHICGKCGRKFARGDALARHNKGPGGCAGRRGSTGEDEDGDETMEGVSYSDETPDSESQRRRSEPHRHHKSTLSQSDASPSLHHHSSTYPGQKVANAVQGSFAAPPVQSPSMLSPTSATGPQGAYFNAHNPSMYAQGGMTESPKPLSPGSTEQKRASGQGDPSLQRGRSPSLNSQLQHQHFSRNSHGTPSLPPPMPGPASSHPQLPSLHPSLNPGPGPPPTALSTHPLPPATGSAPGSASSHHQSSAGSMRDILNNGPHMESGIASDHALYEQVKQVKNLTAENRKLKDDLEQSKREASISEQHYETKIRRLEDEIKSLKQQQQQQKR